MGYPAEVKRAWRLVAILSFALLVTAGCGLAAPQKSPTREMNLWRIAPDMLTLVGRFASLEECGVRGRALMAQRSQGDFREYICLDATWRPPAR
jgi:hypothetical protein